MGARRFPPRLLLVALALAGCGGSAARTATGPPKRPTPQPISGQHEVLLGRSVDGRPIEATVLGAATARRTMLVVGCVHGNEPAGQAITAALKTVSPPPGVQLWVVDQFNPDGCRAGTRQNARGVDLNRNSPWHWRPLDHPGGTFYSGPRPLSEPESRAINRLVRRLRPAITIWYHQHANLVDYSSGGDRAIEHRYATLTGMRLIDYGVYPGSITTWQDSTFPRDTAFVVELPPGTLPRAAVARHVSAVEALMRAVAPKR